MAAPDRVTPRRSDRAVGALVFVGLFAFYIAIQRGDFVSWDGRIMASVARNIWQHLDLHRTQLFFAPGHRAGWSLFGIGMSLVLAPLWGLQLNRDPQQAFWLTLSGPILTAATGYVLYRIAAGIGLSTRAAVLGAFAFGLLTLAPVYSTEIFSEPGVTLALTVALLGIVRWQQGRAHGPWLVGVGIAWTILFRYESIVLVGPLALAALVIVPVARLRERTAAWLLALVLPIAASLVWTGYYNDLRFGSPWRAGPNGDQFTTPLLDGLQRQMLSTGKGFFWYSPILLAAIPGCVFLWRRHRGLTASIIGLTVARVLFFSTYYNPDGSVAWGPRYLVPVGALLSIPLAATFDHLEVLTRVRRFAAAAVLGVLASTSALVVLVSVWVPYEYSWVTVNTLPGYATMSRARVQAIIRGRLDRQFNDWSSSPIALGWRSLSHRRLAPTFPLRWWRGGPALPGLLGLIVAVLAISAAVLFARRRDLALRSPARRRSSPTAAVATPVTGIATPVAADAAGHTS